MIGNFKKIRFKRRLRKLRFIIFTFLKNTLVLTSIAGFVVASVPIFSAYEAHVINVTAKIENDIPTIDPPGGYFCNDGSLTMKLFTSIVGANIIYTTDGTNPDCFAPNGIIYSAPFPLTYSATVKARACHDDNQSVTVNKYFDVSSQYCEEKKYCDARSIGYWQNHEGCPASSNWSAEINALSLGELSGAFGTISGSDICFYLSPKNCPAAKTIEGKLCQAKGKTLANLSNIGSNHLDLNALIAGSDDGNKAFDNLGLNSSSTVREALFKIEKIIIDVSATKRELTDAAYVAERIYAFYEEENENTPWCFYGEVELNLLTIPLVKELPASVCGNGNLDIDIGETCDDGNTISEDGCSEICQIETPIEESKDEKPPEAELPIVEEELISEIPDEDPITEESLIQQSVEDPVVEESFTEPPLTEETDKIDPTNEDFTSEPQQEDLSVEKPIQEDISTEKPGPNDSSVEYSELLTPSIIY
ncbi:MAG: FN3 associated domain-containing protein [Patescibacteria group bacterium]|nr:FN3 associated domain-containing protein [Patescibacteria group bacterium]